MLQWLKLCASNAGGVGSIPGQGTKIPLAHLPGCGQKLKKKEKITKQALPCSGPSTACQVLQNVMFPSSHSRPVLAPACLSSPLLSISPPRQQELLPEQMTWATLAVLSLLSMPQRSPHMTLTLGNLPRLIPSPFQPSAASPSAFTAHCATSNKAYISLECLFSPLSSLFSCLFFPRLGTISGFISISPEPVGLNKYTIGPHCLLKK